MLAFLAEAESAAVMEARAAGGSSVVGKTEEEVSLAACSYVALIWQQLYQKASHQLLP